MPPNTPKNPETRRSTSLWWWVIGAFLLLIAAWTLLINIAAENRPEEVPLATGPDDSSETAEPQP